MSAYSDRNAALTKMGFLNYSSYLESEKWLNIRKRVMRKTGGTCSICSRRAFQVHHKSYAEPVMTGEDLNPLIPLCGKCHRKIEFTNKGDKRPFEEVNKLLEEKLRGAKKYRKKGKKSIQRKCGLCDKFAKKGSELCRPCIQAKRTPVLSLAEAFKSLRVIKGLTPKEVAKELGFLSPTIVKLESGLAHPNVPLLELIEKIYGFDPYILSRVSKGLNLKTYKDLLLDLSVEPKED